MTKNKFSAGWDEQRTQQVLAHYETQTAEEAALEDTAMFEKYETQTAEEAALEDTAMFEKEEKTLIEIPFELLPTVRELLASYYGERKAFA